MIDRLILPMLDGVRLPALPRRGVVADEDHCRCSDDIRHRPLRHFRGGPHALRPKARGAEKRSARSWSVSRNGMAERFPGPIRAGLA